MWSVGFLLLFFGLLAAGMPIFLVLGTCAATGVQVMIPLALMAALVGALSSA